jgi:hypothetical protein
MGTSVDGCWSFSNHISCFALGPLSRKFFLALLRVGRLLDQTPFPRYRNEPRALFLELVCVRILCSFIDASGPGRSVFHERLVVSQQLQENKNHTTAHTPLTEPRSDSSATTFKQ